MFSDPQFWVAVAFVIFILAIFNPVRKIVTSNLDEKIKIIKDSIEEAENLKNEATIALNEIKKRQNKVQNEINLINEEANKKIKQIETSVKQKLSYQFEKKHIMASSKIDQLTRDANYEIKQHISSTAIDTAIYLLEKKLDKNEKQNLINNSIIEIKASLKN